MMPNYKMMYTPDDPFSKSYIRLDLWQPRDKHGFPIGYPDYPDGNKLLLEGCNCDDKPTVWEIGRGRRRSEFLWTTHPAINLMSEKLVHCLREAGITGWATYPVEVPFEQPYYGLTVTGRAGKPNPLDSRVRSFEKQFAPGGVPATILQGLYFEDDRWDGSDFAVLEGTLYVVVTEQVKAVFAEADALANIKFTPLPKVKVSAETLRIAGRLPRVADGGLAVG